MNTAKLEGLRIGYVPYTRDLSGPSDRRRFCHYAKLRGLTYEVYRPGARYDAVFLSSLADVTHWGREPRGGAKLVYDLSDSYLDIDPGELLARLRGPAKFALRQHRHLEWTYHDSLQRMCARADAVMCSTPEQRSRILPFNPNVHAMLDFQGGAATRVKSDYALGKTVNLVWEGQGRNVFTLGPVANVLRRLAAKRPLVVHLVTDPFFKNLNGPMPKLSAKRTADRCLPGVRTYVYEWNEFALSLIATACDLAVIPMVRDNRLAWAKAENKLLLFWRMGLPVVTSATPAYTRTMSAAGLPMACDTESEWERALEKYLGEDEGVRREAAARGHAYAETEHGETALARKWDGVLASLFG